MRKSLLIAFLLASLSIRAWAEVAPKGFHVPTAQRLHSLTFSVYQLAGGPFGLLYRGSVDSVNASPENPAPMPEPATFLLLGAGMLGLAVVLRRMKS